MISSKETYRNIEGRDRIRSEVLRQFKTSTRKTLREPQKEDVVETIDFSVLTQISKDIENLNKDAIEYKRDISDINKRYRFIVAAQVLSSLFLIVVVFSSMLLPSSLLILGINVSQVAVIITFLLYIALLLGRRYIK